MHNALHPCVLRLARRRKQNVDKHAAVVLTYWIWKRLNEDEALQQANTSLSFKDATNPQRKERIVQILNSDIDDLFEVISASQQEEYYRQVEAALAHELECVLLCCCLKVFLPERNVRSSLALNPKTK